MDWTFSRQVFIECLLYIKHGRRHQILHSVKKIHTFLALEAHDEKEVRQTLSTDYN